MQKASRSFRLKTVKSAMLAMALSGVGILGVHAETVSLTGNGLIHTRSAYSVEETAKRIKADVEKKGIKFFTTIDQAKLAKDAGIELPPSTMVMFGNPPLGILFLTSQPDSGMDWPVRVLVKQDKDGKAWAVYQDWKWVAKRYGITNRDEQFAKATEVVMSIMSSIADCKKVADCSE
jgi:uncharacterized protein (DUF302 family)